MSRVELVVQKILILIFPIIMTIILMMMIIIMIIILIMIIIKIDDDEFHFDDDDDDDQWLWGGIASTCPHYALCPPNEDTVCSMHNTIFYLQWIILDDQKS